MQFILQIFPWFSAICIFFKTKYFSFYPKTFKARLLSIVVNISGKKTFFHNKLSRLQSHEKKVFWFFTFCFFITCWQSGKKKLRISPKRQLFSYLLSHSTKNKIADLANSYGNNHHFVNLPRKRKFIFEAKFKRYFLLSFLHFLSDSQLFLRRQKLNNGCEISFKNYFSFLKADREYFFSKHFLLEQNRGWS